MHVGRALQHHDLGALRAADAKLGDRLGAVLQQAPLVVAIDPSPGHDPGAVQGADVLLVRAHDLVDGIGGHEALLDEKRLERPRAQGGVRLRLGMMVAVMVSAHVSLPSIPVAPIGSR